MNITFAQSLRRAALMSLTIGAAGVAQGAGGEAACLAPGSTAVPLVRDVIAAVQRGTKTSLEDVVTHRWAPAALANGRRDAVLADLGGWHWRSGQLTTQLICGVDSVTTYALVANALSEEVDSLTITAQPSSGLVSQYRVRTGTRTYVAPNEMLTDSTRVAAVRRLARKLSAAGVFSGVVLLAKDGRPIYSEALGYANRQKRTPARMSDQYSIASMGKIFTATTLMTLLEQGKLRLTDPIGSILPDSIQDPSGAYFRLPRVIRDVPIQYVLTHRSGIRPGEDTLAFTPGSRFEYSNYGFYLLGRALEHIGGGTLEAQFQRALFTPAGMTRTHILHTSVVVDTLPPNYWAWFDSTGFLLKPNPLIQTIAGSGAGNLFSTAGDLLRFAESLRNDKILSRASVERMRTPDASLGATDYGFGVMRWQGPGIWGHSGRLPGAEGDLELYGDSGYVLVLLSNVDGANDPIRRKVAAVLSTRTRFGQQLTH